MRIIFRIIQWLNRCIFSCKPAPLRRCLSGCFEVHIYGSVVSYQLYFTRHLINACGNSHAARHGHEEDITTVGIGQTCFPHTFGRYRRCPQITCLVHLNVLCHPCNHLHRLCHISLNIFFRDHLAKESLIRSQHFIAYARVTHIFTEISGIRRTHTRLHVIYQHIQTNITKVFCRNLLQKVYPSFPGVIRTQTSHELINYSVVPTGGNKNLSYCIPI